MKKKKKQKLFVAIVGWILVLAFVGSMLVSAFYVQAAESDTTYGNDAWIYTNTLQRDYPSRNVASTTLDAARDWLASRVTNLGYEYTIQSFSVPLDQYIINGDNIIFSKRGESDQVIVVGAHYDSVATNGADDNASGVGVLLETAARISAGGTYPYTIRFILFSAEEPGCVGSQYYVDSLSQEERDRIVAMINIDTIGAGDNMYLYGGAPENGTIVRTWLVEQALDAAQKLGLSMSEHPDVNANFPTPTKTTASDQQAFNSIGIPYLYCEASNWNGEPYTNFYQTSNPAVENGKMMHVAAYDNMDFYRSTFGSRFSEHLSAYTELVFYLVRNLQVGESVSALSGSSVIAPVTEPETEEPATAVQHDTEEEEQETSGIPATIVEDATVYGDYNENDGTEVLGTIPVGSSIRIADVVNDYFQIDYNGRPGYIHVSQVQIDPTTEAATKEPSTEEPITNTLTEEEQTDEEEAVPGEQTTISLNQATGTTAAVTIPQETAPQTQSSEGFLAKVGRSVTVENMINLVQSDRNAQIGVIAIGGMLVVILILIFVLIHVRHQNRED